MLETIRFENIYQIRILKKHNSKSTEQSAELVKSKFGARSCAPGMGDNLAVKVRYALGSRKH